jgi:enoyl-CoA hydratase/carnithine racemase
MRQADHRRVNGHAVGLGATVALMCDIIIAAGTAKIDDPHNRIICPMLTLQWHESPRQRVNH